MLEPSEEFLKLVPERPDVLGKDFEKFPAWRTHQREAVALTLQYIDEGYRYIVLRAPTGFGKSLYAMALSVLLGVTGEGTYDLPLPDGVARKAYVVTETKQLQDQYMRDFPNLIRTIKGRSNYECLFMPGLTANECIERGGVKCPLKDSCPYYVARAEAVKAPVTIFNYAYYLSALNYTKVWPDAMISIFDEGHLAENKLADFIEFTISKRQLKEVQGKGAYIPNFRSPDDLLEWLYLLGQDIALAIEDTRDLLSETEDPKGIKELTERLDRLERLDRKVSFLMAQYDPANWIVKRTDNVLMVRPVWVIPYGSKLLGHSVINLFMSATISEKNVELLGVDRDEVALIDVPALFPKERRPIVIGKTFRLSHQTLDDVLPRVLEVVDKILEFHFGLGDKGIIHTANKRITDYITENSRFKDRLIKAYGENREKALEEFLESEEPVALVSPSLEVGADFKYDAGRFQIIVKAPYPSLGDEITKRRFEQDKDWYEMVTVYRIVQAYGRTNRAEDDFSITYIIDGNIWRLLRSRHMPEWFREAIISGKKASKVIKEWASERAFNSNDES